MPLSQTPRNQAGHIVLSCNMIDLGADGVGGTSDGIARFIAPVRCRLRSVAVAHGNAVVAANGIRVDSASGIIGDDQDQRSMEIPIAASVGGFLCSGFDDRNSLLEQGQMFRVRSDGASGAGIRANVVVSLEPVGPIDFPGPLFCYSGTLPNGLAGTYRFPVPCGIEVLQWWLGLSSTIAPQANNPVMQRNGVANIGTTGIQMAAGGNDLTTFTQARNDIAVDPDRFLTPNGFLGFSFAGAANFTTPLIYTVLCRRV